MSWYSWFCIVFLLFVQYSTAQPYYVNATCYEGDETLIPCAVNNGTGIQFCNNTVLSTCNATSCDKGFSLYVSDTTTNLYSVSITDTTTLCVHNIFFLFFFNYYYYNNYSVQRIQVR